MFAYGVVCALSLAYTVGYLFCGGTVDSTYYSIFSFTLMWIPGVIAILRARAEKIALPILIFPNQYFFYAAAVALLIGAVTTVLSLPFGELRTPMEMSKTFFSLHPVGFQIPRPTSIGGGALLALASLVASSVYIIAALGEELFWRGYLWEKMKVRGFWKASLLIGAGWGLWHWPIIVMGRHYPGFPLSGSLTMITFAIFASPLATYYRVRSKSVIGAAIFHAFMNISATAAFILFVNPNELFLDVEGLAGLAGLSLINCAFFVRFRKKLKS